MTQSPHEYTHNVRAEIQAAVLAQILRDAFKKQGEPVTDEAILMAARIAVQSSKVDVTINRP